MDEPKSPKPKSDHANREERILAFWKEKKIFQKSFAKHSSRGDFTFYDGPPFATGLPHYGHILAGIIKDVIPRWKTMQGYRVRRRWGWDCHGLPVENLIEKELALASKKDIVAYGVGRFNQAARESVMRYREEWRKIVPRLGRFVDMDNDYRTMDANYTESVWWIFKRLYDKGLIYEGFKSMNLCPRCETTLSNFEVAQGYKDITDISVTVKFKIKESPDTSFLAWTTTPWTLPGNAALAVNKDILYVEVEKKKIENGNLNRFVLAKNRLDKVFKDGQYSIIKEIKGSELVGLSYEPLFDYYYKDKGLKNRENGWKIYAANFVTTDEGTGIVHIAPAFGAEDYELSLKHELPFIQHVAVDGTFKKEVTDFADLKVKPIDNNDDKDSHQRTDIEIIKWLAHHGRLFEKEKIVHSYPHCWRCETPLLNYAASSWFVKVTSFKGKLIGANKKVKWVPEGVGKYRFGNWLSEARDWAISRTRFWGAPIPVWVEEKTGKRHIFGSVEDLKKFSKAKNTYYVMRHGEAENNIKKIYNSNPNTPFHLTETGKKQVNSLANSLKGVNIDIIVTSPMLRTLETAEIMKHALNLSEGVVIVDGRISEYNVSVFEGRNPLELEAVCNGRDRFAWRPENGENYADIKRRMGNCLYDLENKYSGKSILIVTHDTPAMLLHFAALGLKPDQTRKIWPTADFLNKAEMRKLDFIPLSHNSEYELDLHRPFIDDVELKTAEGNRLIRVPDVFDCWFESGSMPYGEAHYPFENLHEFNPVGGFLKKPIGYPADFIAEGLDQTRGWFYSMLVLGVALFGSSSYKKVIVNGLILAENGQKMSKSKQNYPDPMLIVDEYGADAMRFYLISSPVVRAQELCFSERGVYEVTKKIVNRLLNVVSFYTMNKSESENARREKSFTPGELHILDQWVISRLNQVLKVVTEALEKGELDRATRPVADFIDDISTWYIRRSRERFKIEGEDKMNAIATTRHVLLVLAKIMAPFTPFLSEHIYSELGGEKESVHLEGWPTEGAVDVALVDLMVKVREIASLGLEARMIEKINVRQPLGKLSLKNNPLSISAPKIKTRLIELIKDEVNVKDIAFNAMIEKNAELDVTITRELAEEGTIRELIRAIQDIRKEKGFIPKDKAILTLETDENGRALVKKNEEKIIAATTLINIEFGNVNAEQSVFGNFVFKVSLKRSGHA